MTRGSQVTSAEEPDGGNLLVRIWRGAGVGNLPAYSTTVFLPRCLRERTPGTPPRGLSGASVSCCLRLQGGALAVASSQSHGGGGAYHLACLLARLLLAEVCS